MKAPNDIWDRLIQRARHATAAGWGSRTGAGAANDDLAPFGFATRVVAGFRELQQVERRLVLWQRLAGRSAIASALLCGVVFLGQRDDAQPDDLLLAPPTIDWQVQ
ncbi:MAG: hypothetical protein ACR2OZ_16585 [Verrucomicrobiales bacterium]